MQRAANRKEVGFSVSQSWQSLKDASLQNQRKSLFRDSEGSVGEGLQTNFPQLFFPHTEICK